MNEFDHRNEKRNCKTSPIKSNLMTKHAHEKRQTKILKKAGNFSTNTNNMIIFI